MAKAEPVIRSGDRATLAEAGDAMMLLVNPGLWEVLSLQAKAEGTTPGAILGKAVESYVRDHGSAEVLARIGGKRA